MNKNEQMIKEHVKKHICFLKGEREINVTERIDAFYIVIIESAITNVVINSIKEIGYNFICVIAKDDKVIAIFTLNK